MKKLSMNVKFYCDHGKIVKIDLATSQGEIKWEIIAEQKDATLEKTIHSWMNDYCHGRSSKIKLPLDMDGVPAYTKKILLALADIPKGKTLSYQELAIKSKNPRAARAVGNACGRNPFPLVLPCHRVLKSDGSLGGFGFGTPLKEALLRFEGAL